MSSSKNNVNLSAKMRQNAIKAYIFEHNHISIENIVKTFNVSRMTAHRDLNTLEKEGLIEKRYGGAVLKIAIAEELPISTKKTTPEKLVIAHYAAKNFISDGDRIFLDSGSTPLHMISKIDKKNVRLITNGLGTLMYAIRTNPHLNVLGPGGTLRKGDNFESFIGPIAKEFIERYESDKVFLSGMGLTVQNGLTEPFHDELEVKKAMIKNSKKRIVLLESNKLGKDATYTACEAKLIDILVTDVHARVDHEVLLNKLRAMGVYVHIAKN
jgi:DeoR family myo-inositol catabolism operon transcriptional repressor